MDKTNRTATEVKLAMVLVAILMAGAVGLCAIAGSDGLLIGLLALAVMATGFSR